MSHGHLPFTGVSVLMVGGLAINSMTMVMIAVAFIIIGALTIRLAFRRGKAVGEV
jgi:hypothetical protein